jgi:glutamate-1-semialdehyde 2,1-aminomutase
MSRVPSLAERSLAIFPGGSPGEYDLPPDLVTVLARGEGARVWDAAGREFTDFTMGWGSVLLGHAHPAVVEAVRQRAGLGSNFAYVTQPALELAEELARAVACAERVRFCASGTEATAYAVRLARAHTGRPKVLKFEGAYHGGNEIGTVSLFPSRLLISPAEPPLPA